MAVGVQTIPRVLLGEALKQLRAEAGVTLDAAAKVIGKDRPRLIKVLDGKATLSTEELAALVDCFGAQDPLRAEILELGIQARKRASGSPYMDLAPDSYRRLAWLEAISKDIWNYQKGIFPSMIQSPDYLDAVMRTGEGIWWEQSGSARADLVAFRLERQRRVLEADEPKRMDMMFTDDTLSAMVGSPAIMRGQLEHVLAMIERHPTLTVRMVPNAASGNPAQSGGLIMLRFGAVLRPVGFVPVAYGPSVYFDETEDTERIMRAFNKLRELALSPAETKAVLEKRLREL
ncbi:Helix-turn-helix domain-containing protein [Amycolatopsis xylanica]|uniref:Helix-turn-helix domain-containing protein n=1 Tax=Amycolatopsis xylanica TaxID=589385 RepID=A0A1H3CKP3_9PSEU|nr:helix-turn-helix transcriptional regulator [Amycolatopsis xylanica]SDX54019.1 Helix-turn-helix domain-containing protein [Amycolatopsis xylanica]